MSRVINIDSTGKKRNQLMRTCAELIRHLSQKQDLDEEVKDMAATLVFCFRDIADGIESSAQAWERRDYWVKAERFRTKWRWPAEAADNLEDVILNEAWDLMPHLLVELLPEFSDIKIAKFTRKPDTWEGAHERLVDGQATFGGVS
jgi:hypothetical protein